MDFQKGGLKARLDDGQAPSVSFLPQEMFILTREANKIVEGWTQGST